MTDADTDTEHKIPVIEIFGPTYQGEGALIGNTTYFIRFGGCDYRCAKCDSMHAVDGEQIRRNATYMSVDEIATTLLKQMEGSGVQLVTLSGGNPALWELGPLVDKLQDNGVAVAIETQGTYYKEWIGTCDVVTISPKGPGMGEKFQKDEFMRYIQNLRNYKGLSVKIVLFDQRDIEFAIEVKALMENSLCWNPVFVSLGNPLPPVPDGKPDYTLDEQRKILLDEMAVLAEDLLKDPRCSKFIFLPQLHVLLWGNQQGV